MESVLTLRDCLRHSLLDILRRPLDWTATMEGLVDCDLKDPVLTVIGPSYMTKSLKETLQWDQKTCLSDWNLIHQNENISGSFAIVGMSGRFPGSDNLDAFWNVLEDGLDLHREVCWRCQYLDIWSAMKIFIDVIRSRRTGLPLKHTSIPPARLPTQRQLHTAASTTTRISLILAFSTCPREKPQRRTPTNGSCF